MLTLVLALNKSHSQGKKPKKPEIRGFYSKILKAFR